MNNKKQEYYSTRLKKLRALPPPSFGIITQLIPLVSIGSSHLRLRDPQSRAAHIFRKSNQKCSVCQSSDNGLQPTR